MGSFCVYCGKPLPENGVCECQVQRQAPQQYQAPQYQPQQYQAPQYQPQQYQAPQYQPQQYQAPQYQPQQYQAPQYQPQQYQAPQYQPQQYQAPQPQQPAQPSAFAVAFSKLMPFAKSFMQNPIAAVKKSVEEKNFVFALLVTAAFSLLSMLAWVTAAIGVQWWADAGVSLSWEPFVYGLLSPVAIVALGTVSVFLGGLISKKKVSFIDALTAVGSASLFPAVIMAVAIVLNLWLPTGALVAALFIVATIAAYFLVLHQVFEIQGFLPMLIFLGIAAAALALGSYICIDGLYGIIVIFKLFRNYF